jgi:hypothetical protein
MAKRVNRSHVNMLGKILGGVLGARIAERSGNSGLVGAAAGYVASRVVRRSPVGALVVGGLWLGKKLYSRNKERHFDIAARNARPVQGVASPAATVQPAAEHPPGDLAANDPMAPKAPPIHG